MTRYSRSVIPGRPSEDAGGQDGPSLDGIVFGSKKKAITPPANDRENDYPDPMDMDVDEAGFLVDRASTDRRAGNGDRRKKVERRKEDNRRRSDYAPLREPGAAHRHVEGNGRGPILLVAAILIVAVFGVVVWNAYREGVRTDDPEATPSLKSAGTFKTPPRETAAVAAPATEIEILEGGPSPVVEERPQAAPAAVAPAAATPAPSKYMAPPPAPLKQPEVVKPAAVAAAPVVAPVATAPAKSIDLPKPSAPTPAPVVAAAAPKPAAPVAVVPVAVASHGAFKPAFASGGNWLVQVAAPSSEAGAIAEWDKRVKALPEFFASAERFVIHADVNGKSVYRLRAGSFASKADADAFCTAYKAKGGNCFPAAK
jgi:hypothetical protein